MKKLSVFGVLLLLLMQTAFGQIKLDYDASGNRLQRYAQVAGPVNQQRYLALLLVYPLLGDQTVTVQDAYNNGCNGLNFTIDYRAVHGFNPETNAWAKYDALMAKAKQLNMKIAIRIQVDDACLTSAVGPGTEYGTTCNGIPSGDRMIGRDANGSNTDPNGALYVHQRNAGPSPTNQGEFEQRLMTSLASSYTNSKIASFTTEIINRYKNTYASDLMWVNIAYTSEQEAGYPMETHKGNGAHTLFDYSTPMINAYRNWLQTKYCNVAALNTKWGTNYANWTDILPKAPAGGSFIAAFQGANGRDWWTFRTKVLKDIFANFSATVKGLAPQVNVIADFGSVYDHLSVQRGTLNFKEIGKNLDGMKVNCESYYDHRFATDLLRSNLPGKMIMNEVTYRSAFPNNCMRQFRECYEHGAVWVNIFDYPKLIGERQNELRSIADTYIRGANPNVPTITPTQTASFSLSSMINGGGCNFSPTDGTVYGETNNCSAYTNWKNAYTNRPIDLQLVDDVTENLSCGSCLATVPSSPLATPANIASGGSSVLSAVCATGTLRWLNGSTIISPNVSPTVTTTYYAKCYESSTCESTTVPVTVYVGTTGGCDDGTGKPAASSSMRGYVEFASCSRVDGWALNLNNSSTPPVVDIYIGGYYVGSTTANLGDRPDLVSAFQGQTTGNSNDFRYRQFVYNLPTAANLWFKNSTNKTVTVKYGGTNTTINQPPSGYTINCAGTGSGSCTGVCSVPSPTAVSATPSTIANGSSSTLSATCATGAVVWTNGNTVIPPPTTVSPTVTTTYYAKCVSGTCESATVPQTVTVQISDAGCDDGTGKPAASSSMRGNVEYADCSTINGWALDITNVGTAPSVDIYVGGFYVGSTIANLGDRPDLVSVYGNSQFRYRQFIYYLPNATNAWFRNSTNKSIVVKYAGTSTVLNTSNPSGYSINCTGTGSGSCSNVCSVSAPTNVTATPASIILGSSSTLSANCTTGNVVWLDGNNGVVSNPSVSPSVTTTYYAKCSVSNSCESVLVPIVVTVTGTGSGCSDGSGKPVASSSLRGNVEYADCSTVNGWALDINNAGIAPVLDIYVGGYYVGSTDANLGDRPDLVNVYGNAQYRYRQFIYTFPTASNSWFRNSTNKTVVVKFANSSTALNTSSTSGYSINCAGTGSGSCTGTGCNVSAPTNVSSSPTGVTAGTSVTLSANCATGSVVWTNGSNNVVSSPVTPSATTTYYAKCYVSNTCESTTVGETVTVSGSTGSCDNGNGKPIASSSLRGNVEFASCSRVDGWALDLSDAATPPVLDIYIGGFYVGNVTANLGDRPDLVNAFGNAQFRYRQFVYNIPTATNAWFKNGTNKSVVVKYAGTSTILNTSNPNGYSINCAGSGSGSCTATPCSVTSPTNVVANPSTISIGSSSTLSATCATGNVVWTLNGTVIGSTVSPTVTTTYNVKCVSGTCESTNVPLTVTILSSGCNDGSGKPAASASMRGYVDAADCNTVNGWALDLNNPSSEPDVDIYVGGYYVGTTTANLGYRPDLESAFGNAQFRYRQFIYTLPTATNAWFRNGSNKSIVVKFAGTSTVVNSPNANGFTVNCSGSGSGNCTGGSTGCNASVPTNVIASPSTMASGSSASLSANCATGSVVWLNGNTVVTSPVSPTVTTTYNVKCVVSSSCESSSVPITVTVSSSPQSGCVVNKARLIFRKWNIFPCCTERLIGAKIFGQNNDDSWTELYTYTQNATNQWQECTFNSAGNRYKAVKFQSGPNSNGEVDELEFDNYNSTTNVTTKLSGTIFGAGNYYANVFDGVEDNAANGTQWGGASNGPQNYVGITLSGCSNLRLSAMLEEPFNESDTKDFVTYPNPSSGKVTVNFVGEKGSVGSLVVHDMMGKTLLTDSIEANVGKIVELPSNFTGMSFFTLTTDIFTKTKKVIIVK
jgi:Beta-galactosidase